MKRIIYVLLLVNIARLVVQDHLNPKGLYDAHPVCLVFYSDTRMLALSMLMYASIFLAKALFTSVFFPDRLNNVKVSLSATILDPIGRALVVPDLVSSGGSGPVSAELEAFHYHRKCRDVLPRNKPVLRPKICNFRTNTNSRALLMNTHKTALRQLPSTPPCAVCRASSFSEFTLSTVRRTCRSTLPRFLSLWCGRSLHGPWPRTSYTPWCSSRWLCLLS